MQGKYIGLALLLTSVSGGVELFAQTAVASSPRSSGASCNVIVVAGDELVNAPTLGAALRGRVTGFSAFQASGQVGSGTRSSFRGNSSPGHTPPIVFLDDVRIGGSNNPGLRGMPVAIDVLDRIRPEDVDRVEIMKGPAATALYGIGASGGLIRIYTKRGEVSEGSQIPRRPACR